MLPFVFSIIGIYMGYDLAWWAVGVVSAAVNIHYGVQVMTSIETLQSMRGKTHARLDSRPQFLFLRYR